MNLSDLALCFESLGDNCEFGLVQRHMGAEPLGLLRFNFTRLDVLHTLLATDFVGIDDPAELTLEREANGEVMQCLPRFGLRSHTGIFGREGEEAAIAGEQLRALGLLRRKLREDLASGDKIFVRKGEIRHGRLTEDLPLMVSLFQAIRRHGPGWLLWVTEPDEALAPGCVQLLHPGLLRGALSRFAHYERAQDAAYLEWEDVCECAHTLRRSNAQAGTILRPRLRPRPANLFTQVHWSDPRWSTDLDHAVSFLTDDLAPPRGPDPVIAHILLGDTDSHTGAIYGRYVDTGVTSGLSYVASAWVWIDDGFQGHHVGILFAGFASTVTVNADTERTGTWQLIWVAATVPPDVNAANPRLYVIGRQGDRLCTTGWRLEQSRLPSDAALTTI